MVAVGAATAESGANGSVLPMSSKVTCVLKSFSLKNEGSLRIVPERVTARNVRSVATRSLFADTVPVPEVSVVNRLFGVEDAELYQKNPPTAKIRIRIIILCLKIKSIYLAQPVGSNCNIVSVYRSRAGSGPSGNPYGRGN